MSDIDSLLPTVLRPTAEITVKLVSGEVRLPVCRPTFDKWMGAFAGFDYGGKPLVNHNGEAVFAELAILRQLLAAGWDGVWVAAFGGRGRAFLQSMPGGWSLRKWSVPIPEDKRALLDRIWREAKTAACFDVFVWRDGQVLFCEGKRKGRDRFTPPQRRFIEAALACGVPREAMLVVEWGV